MWSRRPVQQMRRTGSSAGGPFVGDFAPTDIAGLTQWLRADLGLTISTGVSAWADQSGNGNSPIQATGGNQPTVSSLNGKPSLLFNGSSDTMAVAGMSLSSPYTVFLVGQTQGTGTQIPLGFTGGAQAYIDSESSDTLQHFYLNGQQLATSPAVPLSPFVITGVAGGAASSFRNNGVSSDGTLSTATISAMNIGSFGGADFFQGLLSELIVYNSALTAAQLSSVWVYLQNRYGITP